ncbi:Lrp/AsnC family transcriptional regulator [Sneathiella sp.]|uniref:Lrp/AsnC family transcriptional regulator n=1 Tax=Sneathiella sp. TaxID=1964365 RepID=UPI00261B8E25|nr:Lrp/AsnC family transcriptional regulator [Sneathiella sp.]MDF2366761.1 Lrp/AsnC family transcriptional regulator [Sneathiella sp.]
MNIETEDNQLTARPPRPLDSFDRKILGALSENGRATYAEIGEIVGLSAPAVFERVKRLRSSGTLTGISARIDGPSSGKDFLAFVHVDADGWGKSERMLTLRRFPEVEEMHSVAGDTCVIMKVRTANAHALEQLLSQLYVLPGVRGTKSFIVLSTYLERGVHADITTEWPTVPLPTS